jgi:mycofactocin precursor
MTEAITEATDVAEPAEPQVQPPAPEALVEDDLLVEDVSIDGMCGVY